MDSMVNKKSVLSSLFWKILERFGTRGVQFIIQLILARLLVPENFGTIAIVQVFISLANVFVESGFSTALIQKKDADNLDFSSVFYLSLFIALLLNGLIFFGAPLIANFYNDPFLISILRVLSLNLFFGALISVQNSYIAKNMMFHRQFISSIISNVLSGIIGIFLAFNGYGVWALVFQQLLNQFLISIVLWFTVNWRPELIFSFKRIKLMFSFGSNLLASSLLNTLYDNLRTLTIGRLYNNETLGYHDKGRSIPSVLTTSLNSAIDSVMLPTYSILQDNQVKLKSAVRRSMLTSSFIVFPMMIGIAVIAEPLVILVLTEKWLPAVPFIQIYCITSMFLPLHKTNLQAINAIGRSDIYFKLEIVKKIIGIIILFASLPFGVVGIALSSIASSVISIFINAYPNRLFLQYGYKEQISDLTPSLTISLIMGVVVYLMNFLPLGVLSKIIIQMIFGVIIYLGLAMLFKIAIFEYLVISLRSFFQDK